MTTTLITGYRDDKDVVIPGWKNRLMVTGGGFLPRFATRKLVAKMQDARVHHATAAGQSVDNL